MERKKILIADDEASLRKALQIRLSEDGYEIIVASDGKEALDKAVSDRPDLIILDMIMPKLTGQEVLTELHKTSWGKSVPILFLTNVSDPIKMAEVGEESVSNSSLYDYMIKSDLSLDQIAEKVKQNLESK